MADPIFQIMNRIKFLYFWSIAVGAMDACTGLILIFAPAMTLKLMRVPPLHQSSLVFLSWMGVFIGAVGLAYGLVFRGNREAETVWTFTAIVRAMVLVFLIVKISTGSLPVAWSLVAMTDGIVAIGQFFILRAGWWKGDAG
jgi:hypothetical protein